MSFWIVVLGNGNYLAESSRDDTFALFSVASHHGMRFTTSGLPICKDSAVIAIQYIINKWKCTLLINERL